MSKVWTYVIPRALSASELQELQGLGADFVKQWTAHDNKLDAGFEIVEDRIIRVSVNENTYAASGCSIDKLQRFMKEAGARFGTDLLDRMQVAYERDGHVEVAHSAEVKRMLAEGTLSGETLTYDTTISTADQLNSWKKPLKETWLKKYLART